MTRWTINQRRRDAADTARTAVLDYLTRHPCVDCGEADPIVLEFDHRDPETKRAEVGVLISRGASLRRVLAEIILCDIRCANCHRRRTAFQFPNWRTAALLDPDVIDDP